MRKIKKGDKVQVISGKDKGQQGIILNVIANNDKNKQELHVIVEGVNLRKKHVKPKQDQAGKIETKEAPLAACKVAVLCPTTQKPTRIGIKRLADGKQVRFSKSSGEVIDG